MIGEKFLGKLLSVLIFLLILGVFSLLIYIVPQSKTVQIQSIVLFLSFSAVVWYAYETNKMRQELVRQNELNIQPFLLLYYRDRWRIRNTGRGIANHLEFNQTINKHTDGEVRLNFKLSGENYLLPNEERDIELDVYLNNELVTSDDFKRIYMNPFNMNFNSGIQVRTKDILWEPYLFTFRFGIGGVYLKDFRSGEGNCNFD